MSKLVVSADSLYLRDAPNKNGKIIGVLHKNDIVEDIGSSIDGKWKNINTTSGNSGWSSNAYLQQTTSQKSFKWFEIAIEEFNKHIKEFTGSGDNPRIVQYLQSTEIDSISAQNDETPWCSAFVNWCIENSGYQGTDSAWARSWLDWGQKIQKPVKGCIVVFKRPPNPSSGHVAFFVSQTQTHIKVLGGNQNDSVSIHEYPIDLVLGFRLPNNI